MAELADALDLGSSTSVSYTIDDAVNKIFTKLDEAIDDFENGRVLSEEVVWKQIKRRAITGAGEGKCPAPDCCVKCEKRL